MSACAGSQGISSNGNAEPLDRRHGRLLGLVQRARARHPARTSRLYRERPVGRSGPRGGGRDARGGGLGTRKYRSPSCFISLAASSASAPRPQNTSTRPGPRIAPPVSWLRTKRLTGPHATRPSGSRRGRSVRTKASAAGGNSRASVAMERAGVSGTPRLPRGGPSSRRKKTTDWLCRRTRARSAGFCCEPGADRVHRDALLGQPSLVDQEPPDRPVRAAVGGRRPDPDLAPVREAKGAAALHLHEEDVDGIPGPRQGPGGRAEAAGLDLRPAEGARVAPAAGVVRRQPEDRDGIVGPLPVRDLDDGLVIAGQQHGAVEPADARQHVELGEHPLLEHLGRRIVGQQHDQAAQPRRVLRRSSRAGIRTPSGGRAAGGRASRGSARSRSAASPRRRRRAATGARDRRWAGAPRPTGRGTARGSSRGPRPGHQDRDRREAQRLHARAAVREAPRRPPGKRRSGGLDPLRLP